MAGGGMQESLPIDPLGDNLGVLENAFEDSTEVVDYYSMDSYREFCEMMYKWNSEGLIMPDATTTTENNLLSGNGFAMFENWKPGKELENYKSTGKEVVFMKVIEPYKYTDISNGNSFIIPYSSSNPEKARSTGMVTEWSPPITTGSAPVESIFLQRRCSFQMPARSRRGKRPHRRSQ